MLPFVISLAVASFKRQTGRSDWLHGRPVTVIPSLEAGEPRLEDLALIRSRATRRWGRRNRFHAGNTQALIVVECWAREFLRPAQTRADLGNGNCTLRFAHSRLGARLRIYTHWQNNRPGRMVRAVAPRPLKARNRACDSPRACPPWRGARPGSHVNGVDW